MAHYDRGPIAVELPVDTAVYADGDLLSQAVEIEDVCVASQPAYINSLTVTDFDDQGAALDFAFFDRDPGNLGTLNATCSWSDTQSEYIQAGIPVAAADYIDWGDQQTANPDFNTRKVRSAEGGTSIWVAAVSNGTPTYASGKLLLHVGVVRVE